MAHEQLPIFTIGRGANCSKMYLSSQSLHVLSALCHVLYSIVRILHQDPLTTAHTCLHDRPCLCLFDQTSKLPYKPVCLEASAPNLSWHSCGCNIHRAQSLNASSSTCHLNHALLSCIISYHPSSGACSLWYIMLVPV